MMRRVTWLTAGAVLGVMGYRRLDRATKALVRQSGPLPVRAAPASPLPAKTMPAKTLPASAGLASAVRLGVGMAGWLSRRARAHRARARQLAGGSPHGVSAFVSEVRAGMDEYLDRHQATGHKASDRANLNRQYPTAGNTLVDQRGRDRVAIPGSPLGRTLGETSGNTSDKTKDGR